MKLNFKSGLGNSKMDKDELRTWLILGVIVTVGAFCLYGSKTMLAKVLYQQKVVSASRLAVKQLDANLTGADQLSSQYKGLFENDSPVNFLGGKNDKSANAIPPNVDNARLALDALPINYDYPALIASLTKILTDAGINSPTIGGTDQTATTNSQPSAAPQPVTITLTITGNGDATAIQNLLFSLEKSIRPFDITNLQLSGSGPRISLTASLNTYFQPAKTIGITEGKVK